VETTHPGENEKEGKKKKKMKNQKWRRGNRTEVENLEKRKKIRGCILGKRVLPNREINKAGRNKKIIATHNRERH